MEKHARHVSQFVIGAIVAASLSGSLFASPSPTPAPVVAKPVDKDYSPRLAAAEKASTNVRAPHSPVNLIQDVTIGRIVDRIQQLCLPGVTAGVSDAKKQVASPENPWFHNPSTWAEYSYLSSNNNRKLGTDSITNSGALGLDFVSVSNILMGLSYQYSHQNAFTGTQRDSTRSNSNFLNAYAAKTYFQFLTVGMTGGYGYTDSKSKVRNTTVSSCTNTNSTNVSPFVSLAYAKDNFYTSLTTSYQFAHSEVDDSSKVSVRLAGGYQVAEWLCAEVSGKCSVIVGESAGNQEPAEYYGVGAKLKQPINSKLSVYESYSFDFNNVYKDHTGTVGMSYSF